MPRGSYLRLCEEARKRGMTVELHAEKGKLTMLRCAGKGRGGVSRRIRQSVDYAASRLLDDLG